VGAYQNKMEPSEKRAAVVDIWDITSDKLKKIVDDERGVEWEWRWADSWAGEQVQATEQIQMSMCIFVMVLTVKMIDDNETEYIYSWE